MQSTPLIKCIQRYDIELNVSTCSNSIYCFGMVLSELGFSLSQRVAITVGRWWSDNEDLIVFGNKHGFR